MLLWLADLLAKDIRAFNVFGYLTLRAVLACMTALFISFIVGPRMIALALADEDRAVGARRRPADAPHQGRHADDGRRADPGLDRGDDAAVGRSHQPLRLGRAAGDAGLRRDRLGRRLPEGRLPQSEGAVGAAEVRLAVGDRARRRGVPRVLGVGAGQHAAAEALLRLDQQRLQRQPVAEDRPDRAVLQDGDLSARHLGLHRAHLLRDRRHQQRGQPDRRPRRPRDHADGDDRRRARHLRLRQRQRDLRALPAVSATFPAPASSR